MQSPTTLIVFLYKNNCFYMPIPVEFPHYSTSLKFLVRYELAIKANKKSMQESIASFLVRKLKDAVVFQVIGLASQHICSFSELF